MNHEYRTKGTWQGLLNQGSGEIRIGSIHSVFSVPTELGGPGRGTNPEELILGAAASCMLITLGGIFQGRKLGFQRIEMSSTADFAITRVGPKLTSISHFAEVFCGNAGAVSPSLPGLMEMAKKGCMISNAFAGNVRIETSGIVRQSGLEPAFP